MANSVAKRWLLAWACLALGGSTAAADWHQFWHGCHVDYARVNAWPQPFTDVDTRAVSAPFGVMKHNGWRAHNTIGHELFRPGDAALTAAGHRRVQWIAQQAPEQGRVVYVLRGQTDNETRARLDSIEVALDATPQGLAKPEVFVIDREQPTAPGAWATQISRRWLNELPPPRLPRTSASGTEGAVGQGGGGGASN